MQPIKMHHTLCVCNMLQLFIFAEGETLLVKLNLFMEKSIFPNLHDKMFNYGGD